MENWLCDISGAVYSITLCKYFKYVSQSYLYIKNESLVSQYFSFILDINQIYTYPETHS